MNSIRRTAPLALAILPWIASPATAEPEIVRAFAFGSRLLDCPTHNDPSVRYIVVFQGTPDDLEYDPLRGWGYEVVNPGDGTFGRFGPFDDSANNRSEFPDTCPSELYDSFIGAKNFSSPCSGVPAPSQGPCLPPEGIIFRADIPNGVYRFVAAVGSADNPHTHRIVVEDGGSGPPGNLGENHVTLVHNFDQAEEGTGVFARVGFDGLIPPPGSVNGFVDMDENGLATLGAAGSPTLEVTEGYIRLHQLKGATSGTDANGGDMVILELWKVENSFSAIEAGSTWRYRQGLSEASTPADAWRDLAFDDGSWDAGPAPFGYGEAGMATDLSLLDPPMRNNYTTFFLRQTFEVSNASLVNQLVARVDYDDGFAMWVNGAEVLRINVEGLEGDPVPFDTLAPAGHESGLPEDFFLPDPSGYLVSGTNVVAVQVVNTSITSSDLKFDLHLFDPVAPDVSPPEVALLVPARGTTIRRLDEVQVTFDEDVSGVDAGDLLVGGAPSASVTGSGPGPYVFSFAAQPEGRVDLAWAPGHGITDQAEIPNAFQGGTWSYTVDPDAPLGNIVISEILAANRSGILDEDGETSDWFELVNLGAESVTMAGWSVTDDPEDPDQFVLPAVTLAPQERLVIFASGKDRSAAGREIHTNFRLSSTGEYLGLLNAESPRRVIDEIAPRYPRQRADISYGLGTAGELVYMETPTPGAPNTGSIQFDGFVIEPTFTPGRGIYGESVTIGLSTPTPGARIRYTLDGSEPTPTRGTLYSGPLTLDGNPRRGVVTLRAVAYLDGLLPSDAVTHSYIFPEDVMTQPSDPTGFPSSWNGQTADYEMDGRVVNDPGHRQLVRDGLTAIPTLSIVTEVDNLFDGSTGIYANPSREGVAWERPVSAELIYPDGRGGFQINCGLRIQGGSSTSNWKAIKVSMRLLFKGDYGPTKLRFPLFPDTPVDTFDTIVLDAHLNQTWNHPSHGQRVRAQYVRDTFVSDLQNAAGGYAPHDVFAHVYLNGLYWGVYDLHERPDASFAAQYFGGEKEEYDAIRHSGGNVIDGSGSAWNTMMGAARRDLSIDANFLDLTDHLDIPGLIDYMLVNIWAGNDDWAHHNWYATRFRAPGAQYRFHSWDAEHVLKDVNINRTGVNNSNSPAELYSRLRSNEEFRLLFADHVQRHYQQGGIFHVDPSNPRWNSESPERNVPASIYMRRIEEIDPAIACESARWGDAKRPADPYTRNDEWMAELGWQLDQYFPNRSRVVLGQLRSAGLFPSIDAPVFSRLGGRIQPGFALDISLPPGTNGTIYFTTDGDDPRVFGSGAVSPSAEVYSDSLVLDDHTVVKARIRSGTTWSALTEATFTLNDPAEVLAITEIMYNPPQGSDLEFIELQNTGDATVGLTGALLAEGIHFIFPQGTTLAPGEHMVLVSNPIAFANAYPGVPIGGVYFLNLDNGGERVTVLGERGNVIVSARYDDDGFWPIAPDGLGYSLVVIDPLGDLDDPANWRASAERGGSPGAPDPEPVHGGIGVNEVLANSAPPLEDAIELVNLTASPIDVGGWYLSDSRLSEASLKKYRIPAGTVLPAGGYAVLYEGDFGAGAGGFGLPPEGGAVYLSSADGAGALTGHIAGAEYGPEMDGVSFGRVPTSDGPRFTALRERTFGVDLPQTVEDFRQGTGADNSPALFGPVLINEVMYHPDQGEEFVELLNPTGDPVSLWDDELGRGWRLSGLRDTFDEESFEFGPDDAVPARGFLLVVGIDPDLFRALNAVPAAVPIVGPSSGRLDNGGERLRLSFPALIDGDSTDLPYVTADEVRYDDDAPWPIAPDGDGPSLERIVAAAYADDPANWGASTRVGGTPGAQNSVSSTGGNRPPEALFSATPSSGEAPLDVLLDASRSYDLDGVIVDYAWDLGDGTFGNGRTLAHTFVDPGVYVVTLTVEDDDGETTSATRFVSVDEDLGGMQVQGDSNQDGVLDIADAISILRRLFVAPLPLPCDGNSVSEGGNLLLLDLNNDGDTNLTDAVHMLQYLFKSGPPPAFGTDCQPIPGCPDVCAF